MQSEYYKCRLRAITPTSRGELGLTELTKEILDARKRDEKRDEKREKTRGKRKRERGMEGKRCRNAFWRFQFLKKIEGEASIPSYLRIYGGSFTAARGNILVLSNP